MGTFPGSQHFGGRRACWSFGWGLEQVISESIIHMDLHKSNNKLVSALLEHFWCTNEALTNIDSQDSPWPRFRESHHLPFYSIFYVWPWGLHPNVILSCNSQVGSLEISNMGTFVTLEAHNFLNLWLKWGLK